MRKLPTTPRQKSAGFRLLCEFAEGFDRLQEPAFVQPFAGMASMPSAQSMKQNARHYLSVATDKARLASANVGRGDTMVTPVLSWLFALLLLPPVNLCAISLSWAAPLSPIEALPACGAATAATCFGSCIHEAGQWGVLHDSAACLRIVHRTFPLSYRFFSSAPLGAMPKGLRFSCTNLRFHLQSLCKSL